MSKKLINVNDYVFVNKGINELKAMSVGLVGEVNGVNLSVFFIGINKTIDINIKDVSYLNIEQAGKSFAKKICNRCHILKDELVDFEINQTDAQGRKTTRPSCRECRVEINGEALRADEKKRLLSSKPSGVYTCPICEKTSIVGVTAKFVIDHDHKTGMARQWICDSFNTGLGRFKDDIVFIKRVINYLSKYS